MKISFIVPVYNVENYLHECANSIIRQLTSECELILVDDGSKDQSGIICDEMAAKHDNVMVIHKENGGLSSARNAGLQVARGEYIAFVDSDDRIAVGSVEKMLAWIEEGGADLCFLEAIKFYPDGGEELLEEQIERAQVYSKSREDALEYLSSRSKFPGSACTKLLRRSFLESNNLRFPSDRRYSEDLGFCLDCMMKARSFDTINMPYYEYRQNRAGSITHSVTEKSFNGVRSFVSESLEKLTVNRHPIDSACKYAMSFVAYEYSIMLWHYSCLKGEERLSFLRKNRWVLKYAKSRKTRLIGLLVRTLGIKMTAKVLEYYMKGRSAR